MPEAPAPPQPADQDSRRVVLCALVLLIMAVMVARMVMVTLGYAGETEYLERGTEVLLTLLGAVVGYYFGKK